MYAQKYEGTVYFNDGTEKKGLIKVINDDVLFKKDKKTRRVIYNSSQVDSVSFFDKAVRKYEYIKRENNDSLLLAYVKVDDYLKLYKVLRDREITITAPQPLATDASETVHIESKYQQRQPTATYYLKRRNEDFVTYLTSFGTDNTNKENTFKEVVSEYFTDCQAIIEKVEKEKFKKKDYLKIVEYYNKKCQ